MKGDGTQLMDIRPGVAAVVQDYQGRILLHHRVIGGGWAPPSGAVEPGEDVRSALAREMREETGLTVQVAGLVGIYSDPSFQTVEYPDGRRVQFVTCLFACNVTGGELSGSSEGMEWDWFHPSSLPAGMLPYARLWVSDTLDHNDFVVVR